MTESDFLDYFKDAIDNEGYANLDKAIDRKYPTIDRQTRVIFYRRFTYKLIGSGDYAKEDVEGDGRLLYKREEYYINRRIAAAHDSTIETNKAVRDNFESQAILATSTIQTNKNIRRNNRVIATAAVSAAVFSLLAFIISVVQITNAEKLSPQLELLQQRLQKQELQLELIPPCLGKIDSSIRSLRK